MFKNMKIGSRLSGAFSIVVFALASVIVVAYINLGRYSDSSGWNVHTYQVLEETDEILSSLVNIETGQRGYLVAGKDEFLEPLIAGKQAFTKHFDKAKALTSDNAKQQERLDKLKDAYDAWLKGSVETSISTRRAIGNDLQQYGEVIAVVGSGKTQMDAMRSIIAEIDGAERGLLETRSKEMDAMYNVTQSTLVFGGIVGAILAAIFAFWVTRSIVRPLNEAVEVAGTVAKGDLSRRIEVKSRDEVGQLLQALKDMNGSLAGIVGEVRSTTESITASSQEIAQGNADLSQRTEEQASSLEETASSMEELNSTVKQNAENAKQANQLANNASDIAVKGGQVVGDVVDTMASISTSSRKIVDIISVIEGIAFQTNILALNAAVEAARAGEQGRGFAVVAGEVRNLAQRSAAAAKEIKMLIDDSVSKVDAGSKQVDQAGATMTEIVTAVKRVTDIMAEIAAASNEQSAGIEQVNQAITQMDEVTQQNAALVEEAAAAAEAMQEQAGVLMEAVSIFKLEAGSVMSRAAAKPAVQHAIAKQAAAHHPVAHKAAPATATRRIAKTKAEKDGDWKEF